YCWLLVKDARKTNNVVKLLRPLPDNLIALSDFIQKEFEKNFSIRPQHIIPIGVDPLLFDNKYVEKDLDILGTGSLIPLKQYDVFIEVIDELTKQFPALKAAICGKG